MSTRCELPKASLQATRTSRSCAQKKKWARNSLHEKKLELDTNDATSDDHIQLQDPNDQHTHTWEVDMTSVLVYQFSACTTRCLARPSQTHRALATRALRYGAKGRITCFPALLCAFRACASRRRGINRLFLLALCGSLGRHDAAQRSFRYSRMELRANKCNGLLNERIGGANSEPGKVLGHGDTWGNASQAGSEDGDGRGGNGDLVDVGRTRHIASE